MAKKKKGAGRPPSTDPLEVRMLVRITRKMNNALKTYGSETGAAAASTALRQIGMEKLKERGLL